uniref:OSJNBa0050F15.13 protein n=1 Tax=Oryza sativa subsp. japonica TaxID=39947 RepID=Q7X889_ORYSJ|nr:OSJNBa0050F15.13 [Oryza sativa Japonica Group]
MEKLFIPSFFTIMVHLIVHLVDESKLGGPVNYRWMYPFESFGETIGSAQDVKFDAKTLTQAHRYVLRHLDEIEDFRREFLEEEKRKQKKSVFTSFESDKLINERFHDWLYHKRKFAIDGRAKSWLLHQLDVPNTVDESQWPTLVSYWYSKDSKKISDRNQENALKHPHTLGRKSFTRKRKELEVNEVEVDRETFFDECHKTKDGRYVTDATQEKMVLTDTCNLYNLTPRRTTVAQVKTSVPRALPNLSVIATK